MPRSHSLAALGLSLLVACAARHPSWNSIQSTIDERFPGVPQMGTDELAELLEGPEEDRPLLLDVRTANEYAVSHIEGARRAATVDAALTAIAESPGKPVVAYCSVGYRSAELVQALRARGKENVVNLRGSIFAWANEGRPVVRDGRAVGVVHPYDEEWGQLLASGRAPARYEPPNPD